MKTLKEKRKELNITQVEAARLLGVSRRTYQTYEEKNKITEAYKEILSKLEEIGLLDGEEFILSKSKIKADVKSVLVNYPEVESAYLFGSYAIGKATRQSDVDIMLVLNKPMGIRFFGIAADLSNKLHKEIDLSDLTSSVKNIDLMKDILNEGIKIYGKKVM